MDIETSTTIVTIVGMLTAIFIGWVLHDFYDELDE